MSSDLVQARASGLSDLFDCPARWYAKNIEKRRMPTSSAAQLGTAVHAGAGAYDQGRRAFAWQMAERARRTRRERIIEIITTTIAAVAWVACVMVTSGMLFIVGTDF